MSTLTDARPSVPANHRELAAETAGGDPLGANRSDSYLARRALGLPPE